MSAIELHAHASADFAAKLAQTIALLQQAAGEHAPLSAGAAARISQASSLGAEDVVISHLINNLQLDIGIFVLETGALHAETLALLERLKATSRMSVQVFKPAPDAVVQFVTREGKEAMYRSISLRKACCQIRKMEPLARALDGKSAWITGLRREQSGARAEVPLIDTTNASRVKYNPLANWAWGDVWHFIAINQIAYNPLHDQYFPSIGCAPCTRAISLGEEFRAGRWWWEDEAAKECGLHVKPDAQTHATIERVPT
jgi:phosphoadenosine phosphosulfate reductase